MPNPPTRRQTRYGKTTPAPSMRFDTELLNNTQAQAVEEGVEYTQWVERAMKLYYLLEKHKSMTPRLIYGTVSGQWFCKMIDGLCKQFDGPDPLAALEAALKAEER